MSGRWSKRFSFAVVFCMLLGLLQGIAFAADYDYVSLGYADSVYVKTQDTQPRQLKVVGVIEGDYATQGQYVDLTGQAGLSYTSSDEGVASVDANGYLSVNDYGIATVTVTDGTTTASMLVTVTAEGFLGDSAGKTSYDSDSGYAFNEKVVQETELVRRGDGAVKAGEGVTGAVGYNTLSNRWAPAAGSSIMAEAWVYDPGKTDTGTWTAGTLFDMIDNCAGDIASAWGRPELTIGGNGFGTIGVAYDTPRYKLADNETTTPQRTKGWHQFVMILYNDGTIGEEKMSDGKVIDQIRLANNFRFFIDGQEVETSKLPRNALRSVAAGFQLKLSAWPVDDVSQRRYIELKDAEIEGNAMVGETLTASYEYINTMELDRKDEIKWYRADSAEASDWGAAIGTGESYTLTEADAGKYVKAEISVTATETNSSTRMTEKTTTANRSVVFDKKIMAEQAIPQAQNLAITGTPAIGNQLTASYDFVCEGAAEGDSVIVWEVYRDGEWKPIEGANTKRYYIPVEHNGAQLRVRVTPYDENGIFGETVVSEPVTVEQETIDSLEIFVAQTTQNLGGSPPARQKLQAGIWCAHQHKHSRRRVSSERNLYPDSGRFGYGRGPHHLAGLQ